jgi:hypothetical protein
MDPTAQDTTFELSIHVTSAVDAVQPAEIRRLFRTGTRQAQVTFQHVSVRDDGDPGFVLGDGDFFFKIGAGELGVSKEFATTGAESQRAIDIGSGQDRSFGPFDLVVATDRAPEGIWVQARVTEYDSYYLPPGVDDPTSFADEGVRQFSYGDGDGEAIVMTKWFDLTSINGEIPFTLDTGQRAFDLTIHGRISVQTQDGALLASQIVKPEAPLQAVDHVTYVDRGGRALVGSDTWLQRSLDGELHQVHRTENALHARWSRLAKATTAPITVVQGEHGPRIFSLDDKGRALTLDKDSVDWRPIGGGFVGRLLAVRGLRGPILVGLDQHGAVHQSDGDGEWRRVAEGVAGDLTIFASDEGVSMTARGDGDEVMYRSDKDKEWRKLGRGPRGRLWSATTASGPVFAILREDETLAVAVCDDASTSLDWREAGSINDLLDMRLSLAHFPKFPPARPHS